MLNNKTALEKFIYCKNAEILCMPGQLLRGLAVHIYNSTCKSRLTLDLNNIESC